MLDKVARYKHFTIFAVFLCIAIALCPITNHAPGAKIDIANLDISPNALDSTESSHKLANASHTHTLPLKANIIYFDIPNALKSAHASAIVNIQSVSDKDLMLLYFAGSREGARDVGIYQSFFSFSDFIAESRQKGARASKSADSSANKYEAFGWSKPKELLSPAILSNLSGKFIKKLGNPISFVDKHNRVHLFVVGVSLGGWATAKIYWLMLDSTLSELTFIKELYLSPFLNFSHLVRTPAVLKSDGGFILPIYHELAHKYPLLLDFNANLSLQAISVPTNVPNQLQPSFTPLSDDSIFGVYRNFGALNPTMHTSLCKQSTCASMPSNLQNFGASSIVFGGEQSNGKRVFLAHNQTARESGNKREELWLYGLDSSALNERIDFLPLVLVDRLLDNEVSYPSVAFVNGYYALSYTYGREHIRVALVPKAMLDSTLESRQSGGGL